MGEGPFYFEFNPQEEGLEAITAEPTLDHSTDTITSTDASLNNCVQQRATKQQRSVKKKKVDEDEDSQLIKESFELLKSSVDVMSDPYNSYGQYIANELRKYDSQTLAMVKKSFADTLFKADMGMLSYTNPEPRYFMTDTPLQRSHGSSTSSEFNINHGSPWTTSTQHSMYYPNTGPSRTPTPSTETTVPQLFPSKTGETSQTQNNPEEGNLLFEY
ncbi:hypothetical protein QTP88_007930 [Uroleucon formosanum]